MAGVLGSCSSPLFGPLHHRSSPRRCFRVYAELSKSAAPSSTSTVSEGDGGSSSSSSASSSSSPLSFSPPASFKAPHPTPFSVRPDKFLDILGAALALPFRLGTGAFVQGYSASLVSKDQIPPNEYALSIAGFKLKETSRLGPRPEKPIEIYEFESCPFCRKVREIVSILDLDILFYPCPKNGPNFRPKVLQMGGKQQFPYMVDPNTGVSMYESDDIIKYLVNKYGRLSKDTVEEDLISNELSIYIRGEGLFGILPAVRQRKTRAPADWWLAYGQGAPNLQNFAIKILSLTCSSFGCERNWSIFEFLHNKRRSKMDHGRLKDLVYVKYNRALIRRYNHRDTLDPISLTDIDDANEWLTGKFDDADIEEDTEALIGEDLTWSTVARASGVYERSYNIRDQSKGKQKESSSRSTPITTENEDEEGDEEDEEDEENYSIGDENEGENEALLGCNDDDDDDELD